MDSNPCVLPSAASSSMCPLASFEESLLVMRGENQLRRLSIAWNVDFENRFVSIGATCLQESTKQLYRFLHAFLQVYFSGHEAFLVTSVGNHLTARIYNQTVTVAIISCSATTSNLIGRDKPDLIKSRVCLAKQLISFPSVIFIRSFFYAPGARIHNHFCSL